MGIDCPVKDCKGTMIFFDGGFIHEPIWVCNTCGYETTEPEEDYEKPKKRRKKK